MCLSTVDAKPKRKWGIGYKLVNKRDDRYFCWDYTPKAWNFEYQQRHWITDPNTSLIGHQLYPAGFHLLAVPMKQKELIELILKYPALVQIKCRFRQVTATGINAGYSGVVVVARQMKILEGRK
jgi:hypothetical protein